MEKTKLYYFIVAVLEPTSDGSLDSKLYVEIYDFRSGDLVYKPLFKDFGQWCMDHSPYYYFDDDFNDLNPDSDE